jgi:hypothetical protein
MGRLERLGQDRDAWSALWVACAPVKERKGIDDDAWSALWVACAPVKEQKGIDDDDDAMRRYSKCQ